MKRTMTAMLTLCLAAGMALPASALEYTIEAPDGPDYGKPTSVEVVHTADGGARKNEDVSKNAALIPPGFGTPSMVNGSCSSVITPGSPTGSVTVPDTTSPSTRYTEVTDDLYYKGGYLATLKIPAIDLTVKVYEGTDSKTLAKGAGHFEDTSIWRGNIALAAHNRGVNNHFGQLHTLEIGDKVTLTTKLGTKTYEVSSVEKVSENDTSGLNPTANDQITMYTCVRNQRDNRWKVVAVAN